MANGNIIRPAVLNLNPANNENLINPNPNPPAYQQDMDERLTRMVAEIFRREGRQMINAIVNPGVDINNEVDQVIDAAADVNLADMDRIPDVVKSLRVFSGEPGEFSSWKKSVDRILTIYEHLRGTPKYYGILSVIRNKVIGNADIALESYNTPLNWSKISKCLTLHYADKRDLGTLEYQMTMLVQGNSSIPEFYQGVYHHLSLILNKLACIEMSQESLNNMTQSYREKALDTFVRGLKGDLPRLLSIKEPVDLPMALHHCLKLQNVDFRVQHAHNTHTTKRVHPQTHNVPVRRGMSYPPQHTPAPRNNFYPELINNPQRFQRPTFHNPHFASPRPPFWPRPQYGNFYPPPPKPQPRPEPMDVDRSIHSRQINYANRPFNQQFTPQKRYNQNYSNQMHRPNKFQRIYYTEQSNDEQDIDVYESDQDFENYENCESYESNLDAASADDINDEETQNSDNINFLD